MDTLDPSPFSFRGWNWDSLFIEIEKDRSPKGRFGHTPKKKKEGNWTEIYCFDTPALYFSPF